MKRINFCLIAILIIFLTSCGFHLRGTDGDFYKFPFETIYVECDHVVICKNFTNIIQTESLAILVTDPTQAEVMVKLLNEQNSKDVDGLNAVGRVSNYQLTYQADAEVWQQGEQIGKTIHIFTQANMQYNDATILANNQSEEQFWDQLHDNATEQLIRRLIYFQYRNYSLNVNESKSK